MLLHNIFIRIKAGVFSTRQMIIACCAFGIIALPTAVRAANIGIGSGIRIDPPIRSMKDLRDKNLVKQRFDYSCGAAGLATILRYGFGEKVTEREILAQLFDLLSEEQKKISRKKGFSLLDLQRVARARGYEAEGFRLSRNREKVGIWLPRLPFNPCQLLRHRPPPRRSRRPAAPRAPSAAAGGCCRAGSR